MQITIDIIKENKQWNKQPLINNKLAKKILTTTLEAIGVFNETDSIEVALLLTNNDKITQLNNNFREKNKPTNVLSFPDRELDFRTLSSDFFKGSIVLGDIAMSYDIIEKEAESFFIKFENHFTHLLVHAILHLIGYDHENDDDAVIMAELEIKILNKFDIKKPPIYA